MPARLPIDEALPDILAALRARGVCVVEAPPGAGKSTRVPGAILDGGLANGGQVVVLQPRRLAARLLAGHVAGSRGGRVGDEVGYRVRFEDRTGPGTRLVYATEGTLLRLLLRDPELRGVGALVLDEVHERTLDGDLVLALAERLRRTRRPDLRLVAMSATLDVERLAAFLDGAPRVRSEGRAFPVELHHLSSPDPVPGPAATAEAARAAVTAGDVLVFLPGAAEIREAAAALSGWAAERGVDLRPLHGDLPLEDQAAAVRPGGRPRVILATNVAETSVTVEGVRTVVDTGLARVATWSPWSGFPGLEVRRASRAALAQRAGRAGRTAPGRCVRLFSEADLRSRDAFEAPGILRADLAAATLLLAGAETSWEDLRWLDEPGAPAREAALGLLKDLGALDRGGALTGEGRAMLELPLHPRAARVLLEGCRRGVGADACLAAALLEGREVRAGHRGTDLRPAQEAGDADLLDALERLRDLTPASAEGLLRRRDLDPGAARPVLQAASRLREASRHLWTGAPPADPDAALRRAILAGYPDRVVRRRRAGGDAVVTGEGTELQVSPASLVRHPELMVAVDAGERRDPRGRGLRRVVWSASAVEPEWLLDLDPAWTREALRVEWNASAERVEVFSRLEYRGLPLSEDRVPRARWPDVSALLLAQARKAGLERVADATAVARLRARVAFVAGAMPGEGWSPLADEDLDAALGELCRDAAGFAELRQADLAAALRRRLPRELAGALDRLAPEHVGLPGRRRAVVEYPEGSRPFVASFLQDFFRLKEAPALAGGRVRLLVHLLAPNRRAVQITDDLEGFWARHYPALRRQLMRRYPKHRWPEDPLR